MADSKNSCIFAYQQTKIGEFIMYNESELVSKQVVINAIKAMNQDLFDRVAKIADKLFIDMPELTKTKIIYAIEDSLDDEFADFLFECDRERIVELDVWETIF